MPGTADPGHVLDGFVDDQGELHPLDIGGWIKQRIEDVTGNDTRSGQTLDRSGPSATSDSRLIAVERFIAPSSRASVLTDVNGFQVWPGSAATS